MRTIILTLGALLLAAPLFSQFSKWTDPRIADGRMEWFHLLESESEVRARLGQSPMMADFGAYRSWQYRIGEELDHDEFTHALVFRKTDGKLVSISRTYAPERNVDAFFPPEETKVCTLSNPGQADFSVRARPLPGGGVLMAIGSSQRGQPAGQIVLMHESELAHFYPWVEVQLKAGKPRR
jgi:hypothetical protein